MSEHWHVRLRKWVCAHIGHRWTAQLDEHGKPYANLNRCRRCNRLVRPDSTRYATGELRNKYV
jgi:NAD-dependent SIR2 family protein deacetylase